MAVGNNITQKIRNSRRFPPTSSVSPVHGVNPDTDILRNEQIQIATGSFA